MLLAAERRQLALLCTGVVLLYLPALRGQVLDWDDGTWVLDPIRDQTLFQAFGTAFLETRDQAWYPVLRLSWWLQHQLFGASPMWAHAHS